MKNSKKYFFWVRKTIDTVFSSLRVTLPYIFSPSNDFKESTEEYPDKVSARMPEDLPTRYRGFLFNDIERCSGCRYCSEICPTDCIRIETEAGPEKSVSWVSVFDIDHSRCMFCGFCVEHCPTKSLIHTKEYEGAVTTYEKMVASFGRGWVSPQEKSKWQQNQKATEQSYEDKMWLEQSPVGSELKKRALIKEKAKADKNE